MTTFESMHPDRITGKVTVVDRIIFKGHLRWLFNRERFMALLSCQSVLLKDFGRYAKAATDEIREHARRMAERSGRPVVYLASASTRATRRPKEEIARRIAERDGITEGLICVLSTLETCTSVDVRGNHRTPTAAAS